MTGLGTQLHSRNILVDSYPWLGGDTVVEIWSNGVYGWVECPWSVASRCSSFIKISALCCDITRCV
jgi:hypothetical protein